MLRIMIIFWGEATNTNYFVSPYVYIYIRMCIRTYVRYHTLSSCLPLLTAKRATTFKYFDPPSCFQFKEDRVVPTASPCQKRRAGPRTFPSSAPRTWSPCPAPAPARGSASPPRGSATGSASLRALPIRSIRLDIVIYTLGLGRIRQNCPDRKRIIKHSFLFK